MLLLFPLVLPARARFIGIIDLESGPFPLVLFVLAKVAGLPMRRPSLRRTAAGVAVRRVFTYSTRGDLYMSRPGASTRVLDRAVLIWTALYILSFGALQSNIWR